MHQLPPTGSPGARAPESNGSGQSGYGIDAASRSSLHLRQHPTALADRPTVDENDDALVDDRAVDSNHLLRLLAEQSRDEYDALMALVEPVVHERGSVLYEPGLPVPYVYFPRTSVCSIVKIMADGRRVEVGTTGYEGLVGLPVFLDAETTPFECFVQVAGSSWRLPAAALRDVSSCSATLHGLLQRYAQYLFDQAAQSVACNRLHSVDERCARWLLMTHDRVRLAERFPLTQQFLAYMLGVRRASVSVAAEALQRQGRIRYARGIISVLDRPGLESAACECYQTDRDDYRRLLG